jgi:hypothetical protein
LKNNHRIRASQTPVFMQTPIYLVELQIPTRSGMGPEVL